MEVNTRGQQSKINNTGEEEKKKKILKKTHNLKKKNVHKYFCI